MSANLMSLARSGGKFLKLFGDRKMVRTLPYLRRVAYLESHGTEYIDTGVVPEIGCEIECEYFYTGYVANSNAQALFSAGTGTYQLIALGAFDVVHGFWFKYFSTGHAKSLTYYPTTGEWYRIFVDAIGVATVGGSSIVSSAEYELDGIDKTLYLLARRDKTSFMKGRIRSFSFSSKTGNKLLDLIPVLDLSGRPAMYDKVSGQFFYNQGTGEFAWGELDSQTT